MPYVMEDVITTRMIGLSSASLGYIYQGCQNMSGDVRGSTQIGKVYTVCHANFVDIVSFVICNKQI